MYPPEPSPLMEAATPFSEIQVPVEPEEPKNTLVDVPVEEEEVVEPVLPVPLGVDLSQRDKLRICHNDRSMHVGVQRTWTALNKNYPGHRISLRMVKEYISECPVCQKSRFDMNTKLPSVVRHLKPEYHHLHSTVGLDTLTITPVDKYGNKYLTVVVNHFTKHSFGYASAEHTAATVVHRASCR